MRRAVASVAALVGLAGVPGTVRGDGAGDPIAAVAHDFTTGATRALGGVGRSGRRTPASTARTGSRRRGAVGAKAELPKAASAADDRFQVQPATAWPWSAACKVVSTFPGSVDARVGSAVMVGPHHALTAGRLVRDKSLGGWASSVVVTPDFDDGSAPCGAVSVSQTRSFGGWIDNENPDHDVALLVLGQDVGYDCGWLDTWAAPDDALRDAVVSMGGYPLDKFAQSGADRLWGWTGSVAGITANRISYGGSFDAGGGQNGSGLWLDYSAVTGRILVVGIHDEATGGAASGARIDAAKFPWISAWLRDYDSPAELRIAWVDSSLGGEIGPDTSGVVGISVANDGDAPAEPTVSLAWRDASGAVESMTSTTPTIVGHAHVLIDVPVSIPSDASAGKGRVEVTINASRTVLESDYSNGFAVGPEWTIVRDWRAFGLGSKSRDALPPGGVARYRFRMVAVRRKLSLRLSGKLGQAVVRRPDGSTFTMSAGRTWTEPHPQTGIWSISIANGGAKRRVFRLLAKPSKK